MRTLKTFFAVLLLFSGITATAQTRLVDHFTKVIVSPYIQVTFVEGDEESVTINDIRTDESKLHIEVSNQVLRIYLEGAKDIPKYEKDYSNGYKDTRPLYRNTTVIATVTYKTLNELSVRGEEKQVCKSPIDGNRFTLRIYGESKVTFAELTLQEMETTVYGEGVLKIESGTIREQKYTCYGDAEVNSLAITGKTSHITAYGDADFRINVSDRIKITAFGDARVHYKGDPEIAKGLHFGDMSVDKLD